jgi:hypothetical protein
VSLVSTRGLILVGGTISTLPEGTPPPLNLLAFPTTEDNVPSTARLLTSQWLSQRRTVCALVGCPVVPGGGDDGAAAIWAVSQYLAAHVNHLAPLVHALVRDIDAWEV